MLSALMAQGHRSPIKRRLARRRTVRRGWLPSRSQELEDTWRCDNRLSLRRAVPIRTCLTLGTLESELWKFTVLIVDVWSIAAFASLCAVTRTAAAKICPQSRGLCPATTAHSPRSKTRYVTDWARLFIAPDREFADQLRRRAAIQLNGCTVPLGVWWSSLLCARISNSAPSTDASSSAS